jgi:hypothetical protein
MTTRKNRLSGAAIYSREKCDESNAAAYLEDLNVLMDALERIRRRCTLMRMSANLRVKKEGVRRVDITTAGDVTKQYVEG